MRYEIDLQQAKGLHPDGWTGHHATFNFSVAFCSYCRFYFEYALPIEQAVLDAMQGLNIAVYINQACVHQETLNKVGSGVIAFDISYEHLGNRFLQEIHLESSVWIPALMLNNGDTRRVGLNITKAYVDATTEYSLINSFEKYDQLIKGHVDGTVDNGQLCRQVLDFDCFAQLYGIDHPKCDPLLPAYLNWEIGFFEFLSGKKYDYANEGLALNLTEEHSKPPTMDWGIDYRVERTRVYMEIISRIRPQPGACVLEMGFGYGDLLELLGRCGCRVFGIDASPDFLEYTKSRLSSQNIEAGLLAGSFFDIKKIGVAPDVIIFEASFHHCNDPYGLLKTLWDIMPSHGKIYFINEPILPQADRPWGLIRYDGESLFQIRHRGWLEFGFRKDFFDNLLSMANFTVKSVSPLGNGYDIYEVIKLDE